MDFLAGRGLGRQFRGEGLEELTAHFAPLDALAPALIVMLALGGIFTLYRAFRSPRRRLYRILALWLLLPLAFPAVTTFFAQSIVYLLPLLPAPFIAAAAAFARLPARWRMICAALALFVCAYNANAIWQSAVFVRAGVEADDPQIWAVGGGAPLSTQFEIAQAAQDAVEAGLAQELIAAIHPVVTMDYEYFYHALPLLAPDLPIRFLDVGAPNRFFPAHDSLLLFDGARMALPAAYATAKPLARSTRFELFHLPAPGQPEPATSLPGEPEFANGLRLLGYDGLDCQGRGRLHWATGDASAKGHNLHFFFNLLDAAGEKLAQNDVRALDPPQWRSADYVLTEIDFKQSMPDLPVETLRVGLYYWLAEGELKNVYALDAGGQPWLYAVDIPYDKPCGS